MSIFTASDNRLLPETARYGHIPGLDGLRAIAVLIVMLAHMGYEHIIPGGFGVTVFFFISGFLITRLLLAETEKKGRVALPKFYIRRAVRLYPALIFMVLGTTALYLGLGYSGPTVVEFTAALGYFTNIFQVMHRIDGVLPFMPWTHLWSLAVEEHFYLIFPLLLSFCGKNWRHATGLLVAILVAVPLWRLFIYAGTTLPAEDYNYMMTDARFDSLAWGCFLTVILHRLENHKALKLFVGLVPVILAVGAILFSFVFRDDLFRYTLRFSVQGAALFVLVLNYFYLKSLRFAVHIADLKPLVWIGQISYALYLWHVPVFDLTQRYFGNNLTSLIFMVVTSFALAAVSFYIVEKPFIALRKRFGSHIVTRKPVAAFSAHPDPANTDVQTQTA